MRALLLVVCFLGLAIGGGKYYCYRQADGFAVRNMTAPLPFNPTWEISYSDEELREVRSLLNQPYRYLSKGAQSYVFLSEDGQYVIKFFRKHHFVLPSWTRYLHLPLTFESYRLQKLLQKRGKLERDFSSNFIAFKELKTETGLVFMHLNKSRNLNQQLLITDKLGFQHHLNVDEFEFLIQKTAVLAFPFIEHSVHTQGIEAGKIAIASMLSLLKARCEKGIYDKDPDLSTNFGFIGNQCVQIDTGRFRKDDNERNPDIYRPEMIRITDQLHRWLQASYPELAVYLEQQIHYEL